MEDEQKIDILNREEFINRIVNLVETISKNKGNKTFAIYGRWGVGKTWVIEEIEKQLQQYQSEETVTNNYLVIHYNCWQYDYYQEPLVAIVSVILNFVENTHIFNDKEKKIIKKVFSTIAGCLLEQGNKVLKAKIGIDILSTAKAIRKDIKQTKNEIEEERKQKFSFDSNYGFNAILDSIKKELSVLSEKYTIVFVVDELDRCLPEYAIKVLERLHHIFENIYNCQVILSIDKSQLENTVKTIYGDKVNLDGYIAKFIDFSITLPKGDVNKEKFDVLFNDYVKMFNGQDNFLLIKEDKTFIQELFKYTDIRRQIKVLEKAKLTHSLIKSVQNNLDKGFLYLELVLTLFSFIHSNLDEEFNKEITRIDGVIKKQSDQELYFLCEKVFEDNNGLFFGASTPNGNGIMTTHNIGSIIFTCIAFLYKNLKQRWQFAVNDNYVNNYMQRLRSHAQIFVDTLKLLN